MLSSHSKETAKEILHAATTAAFFQTVFAIFVVEVALLFVGKNLISLLNLLELFFVSTTVRVLLQGLFSVSLFDFVEGRVLFNFE